MRGGVVPGAQPHEHPVAAAEARCDVRERRAHFEGRRPQRRRVQAVALSVVLSVVLSGTSVASDRAFRHLLRLFLCRRIGRGARSGRGTGLIGADSRARVRLMLAHRRSQHERLPSPRWSQRARPKSPHSQRHSRGRRFRMRLPKERPVQPRGRCCAPARPAEPRSRGASQRDVGQRCDGEPHKRATVDIDEGTLPSRSRPLEELDNLLLLRAPLLL